MMETSIKLHRCKLCGVLFGTEGPTSKQNSELCQLCISKEETDVDQSELDEINESEDDLKVGDE